MKCITVYTNNYETFSTLLPDILKTPMAENEEKEVDGIVISESGEVPVQYIEKMRAKPSVAVLKADGTTILQHKNVFEVIVH